MEEVTEPSITFPEIVDLNVGGRHLTTLLSTLRSFPDSSLAAMFNGRTQIPMDKDGRYFIDADGDIFNHILNFLRFQTLPPAEKALEVQKYADYFGIKELSKRQLRWGPVLEMALKEGWKRKIHCYETCLSQIRDGLGSYDIGSGYFYIQFSDASMHMISLCNINGISDGHPVINVKFYSSKTSRTKLVRVLLEDLKTMNIYPDSEDIFQPDSRCACRVAYRFRLK